MFLLNDENKSIAKISNAIGNTYNDFALGIGYHVRLEWALTPKRKIILSDEKYEKLYYYKSQVSLLRCICDAREEGYLGAEGQAGKEHLVRREIHQRTGKPI